MLAKDRGRWAVSQKRLMIQKPSATQAKTHSVQFDTTDGSILPFKYKWCGECRIKGRV